MYTLKWATSHAMPSVLYVSAQYRCWLEHDGAHTCCTFGRKNEITLCSNKSQHNFYSNWYQINNMKVDAINKLPTWTNLDSSLTHWGRVTHICVGNLTIIGSDNGLSPERCQAINWTNAAVLLIGPKGTNFNQILNEIHIFSFKKMHLNVSSVKRRPFSLGLNVLPHLPWTKWPPFHRRYFQMHFGEWIVF